MYVNQVIELYINMTDWTRDKTPEEVKEIYGKRTEDLNKLTIENTPEQIKEERIKKHTQSYNENRKRHKNYKPFKVRIEQPGKTPLVTVFESERDFFDKTLFEATTLVNLKKNGIHKVKRTLPTTKHSFVKGTVLTVLHEFNQHLSEGKGNT